MKGSRRERGIGDDSGRVRMVAESWSVTGSGGKNENWDGGREWGHSESMAEVESKGKT